MSFADCGKQGSPKGGRPATAGIYCAELFPGTAERAHFGLGIERLLLGMNRRAVRRNGIHAPWAAQRLTNRRRRRSTARSTTAAESARDEKAQTQAAATSRRDNSLTARNPGAALDADGGLA